MRPGGSTLSTYSNRLYDHFQKERLAFGRLVLAVVSMGVFFALVFQPYMATHNELEEIKVKLTELGAQIANIQGDVKTATSGIQRANRFMGDASDYQALYEETGSWVDNLDQIEQLYDRQSRNVASLRGGLSSEDQASWQRGKVPSPAIIRKLREARPNIMKVYKLRDDCFFRLETDWVQCQIDKSLTPIQERLARVLYDRTESHEITRELKSAINENREKFEAGLSGAMSRGEPAKWVRQYLDAENAIIRTWYERIAEQLLKREREARERKEQLTRNETQEENLESRKKEISQSGKFDTPIGPLPVAFLDTLTLLPLLLFASGWLLLRSQSRLLALYQGFQRQAPEEEGSAEAMKLTLSMWLDPVAGRLAGLAVLIVMLIPGIAALVGMIQVLTSPGLDMAPVQLAGTLLSAAFFAMQYARLCLAWRC